MPSLSTKQKIIAFGIIIVIILIVFMWRNHQKPTTSAVLPTPQSTSTPSPSDKPQIVSTKPDPLDQIIIPADQIIEITFNRPLENVGEFKVKIEPKVEVKVELSGDRKTGKITPVKPYELGSGYTLSIGPDTKFDGVGAWEEDKSFQFRTIRYRGV